MIFKKKPPADISLSDVTSRIRGFLLDSQIQNAHELAVIIGCSPLSDDVADKEEQESDKRIGKVSNLIPLMYAYSHTLAEAAIEYQKENLEGADKIPEEIWKISRKMTEQIAISTLLGAISQLVDMGALNTVHRKKRGWL